MSKANGLNVRRPGLELGRIGFACAALVCAFAGMGPAAAATKGESVTVLAGATLIDGNGGAPVQNAVVVVTGNRITRIGAPEAGDVRKWVGNSAAKIIDV